MTPALLALWRFRSWIGAGVALVAVLALGAVWVHRGHELASAKALAASQAQAIAQMKADEVRQAAQTKISDAAEQKQIVIQHDIQVQTRTIVKEVPTYVTPEADARCILPVGFVRLYNAAALGSDPATVPAPAGLADGAPSGIACSEVAADLADNFGIARSTAAQLTGLQAWNVTEAALH
jgi:phosphoribosylformylglycinamidine (FGAM) synthase-like enzyme